MGPNDNSIYHSNYYQDWSEEDIRQDCQDQGFDPATIHNRPGYIYSKHQHPEAKLIAILEGDMCVTVDGKHFQCQPGDKLLIPGNTPHSAKVGEEGCRFFWSEKLHE